MLSVFTIPQQIMDTKNRDLCVYNRKKSVEGFSGLKNLFHTLRETQHKAYVRNSNTYNLHKRDVIFKECDWV